MVCYIDFEKIWEEELKIKAEAEGEKMTGEEAIRIIDQSDYFWIRPTLEEFQALNTAIEALKEQERVSCAHCKRYDRHGHRCKRWNHGVSNVDWCSYGERKEE